MLRTTSSLAVLLALAPAASAFCATPLQGAVWIVGPLSDPEVDAETIDDALALAGDGDLILVRPGTATEPFTVDGLSITIQGDPNGAVLPDFQSTTHPVPITVQNLAPGQSVTLRDLVIFQFGNENPALRVRNNQGPVLFDDCFFDFLGGATIAEVRDSVSVSFTGGLLQVKALSAEGIAPGDAAGIDALRSNIFLDNTSVSGPSGFNATPLASGTTQGPSHAAPAVRLRGSSLTALSSALQGGSGGHAFVGCFNGGSGGSGVVLDEFEGIPSTARLVATSSSGGFGGAGSADCAFPGTAGQAFEILNGTVDNRVDAVRQMDVQALIAPNDTFGLTLVGEVGDAVTLIADVSALPGAFLPSLNVTLHLVPQLIVPLGPLNAGIETRTLGTPGLPPSVQFMEFSMQGVFLNADGARITGPTGSVLVSH